MSCVRYAQLHTFHPSLKAVYPPILVKTEFKMTHLTQQCINKRIFNKKIRKLPKCIVKCFADEVWFWFYGTTTTSYNILRRKSVSNTYTFYFFR